MINKHNANMKKEEILKKAIEKAVKNGWAVEWNYYDGDFETHAYWTRYRKSKIDYYECEEQIIFSHDFAKAFWGEESIVVPSNFMLGTKSIKIWQYHLQQMVLEKDPIKYLEQFIK